ncbi:YhgE/Pip family protein [Nonomuraea soli]|uniref:Putative membrane protein n=1 Tax=Nonomuraea soli TaxID=1032476 RepID=A0A7W0HSR3_9ACTN|nr:YhgE/Pip domain-containing protein [Nonomuraea soli]MBA2894294.1 putative membrane protein [Nonomuraea soli]
MRVLDLALFELRRFRKPLQRAGLAFLLIVPLLYGATYLWANWDPYGKADQIPVAVVNEDVPVTVKGKQVHAGQDFVDELKDDPQFQWHYVSAAEAQRGQREGRYFLIITVPADFSAKVSSAANGTAERATMTIQADDGNNYVVGTMAKVAQSELHEKVNAAAVEAYFDAAFEGLDKAEEGLDELEKGARELDRGAASADEGGRELVQGVEKIKAGTAALAPGAAAVSAGVDKLNRIAQPLAELAMRELPIVADRANRIAQLAAKITGIGAAGAREIARIARAVADILYRLCDRISVWIAEEKKRLLGLPLNPDASDDFLFTPAMSPLVHDLLDFAELLAMEAARIARLAGALDNEVSHVAREIAALKREVPALQRRIARGARDIQKLDDGARLVAKGAKALDSGVGTLLGGAEQLSSGLGQLKDGTGKLVDGIEEGRGELPTLDSSSSSTLADPVDVRLTNVHAADSYGRGLAPFFIPISLWVFGVVAFLMLHPVGSRALASGAGALTVALSAWLPVAMVGQAAALLLYGVVDLGLGLDPVNVPGTIGLMALGMATFATLIQLLRVAIGGAGAAVALVLLILQLVASGGLFPVPTLPGPLVALHPLLPMSYLISALRVTISGGNPDITWHSVAVLAGFFLTALALIVVMVSRQRVWNMERFKPTLEL